MEEPGSPGPTLISPRSKVAQMLADIDNAPTPSPPNAQLDKDAATDKDHSHGLKITHASPSRIPSNPKPAALFTTDDEMDDDSDADIRAPTGRAARRMAASNRNVNLASAYEPQSAPTTRAQTPSALNDDEDFGRKRDKITARSTSKALQSPPANGIRSTLFVSPAKSMQEESENELPVNPFGSKEKLAALVAQKRAERLAEEAEARKNHESSPPPERVSSDLPDDIIEDQNAVLNPEIERIMSDAARPTRKASKKALLEMERETQRLARQQALAHQIKVKKKFTTSDLFAKFNFRPASERTGEAPVIGSSSSSSAPNSDGPDRIGQEFVTTPPSTPPTPLDRQKALVDKGALSQLVAVRQDSITHLLFTEKDEDLPDIADVFSSTQKQPYPIGQSNDVEPQEPRKGLRLAKLGKMAVPQSRDDNSDDDELDILQNLPSYLKVFDKVKGTSSGNKTDSNVIHILKHLSHIGMDAGNSGRKPTGPSRPSITPQALQVQLRLRAKEQARLQQLERIAELKAKGIDVQTNEEREREAEEFESLLEKARQDAVMLRKAEKAAGKEAGEDGMAASEDESEDEDYVEDELDSEGDNDAAQEHEENGVIEDIAEEGDEEEEHDSEEEEEEVESDDEAIVDEAPPTPSTTSAIADVASEVNASQKNRPPTTFNRQSRKSRLVVDDDDDIDEEDEEPTTQVVNPTASDEEQVDPFAAFGFGETILAQPLMSPTQAFNATMQTPTQATQGDSFEILRRAPPSASPIPAMRIDRNMQIHDENQDTLVPGSQFSVSHSTTSARELQPPETPTASHNHDASSIGFNTPGWLPSQDPGLPTSWQAPPRLDRGNTAASLVDDETQSTVRLRISESPAPASSGPRRNRVVRRTGSMADSSDEEDIEATQPAKASAKDAFHEMARKRKEALTAAELVEAQHEAKRMMDEQAEESDDEYAGLGGDDYVAPETEEDREIIDSSHVEVDERALAAHYAERQRVSDEAAASKLYKDLMTGALRRKQSNMFDLDEDEGELAVRRRQMRQREEARKRKLLLQDDNIAGLAEGKRSEGKDAFLKAIADDDGEDDLLDLSEGDQEDQVPATQSESQPSQPSWTGNGPLQEVSGNKRRLEDTEEDRAPAKQRRTQASAFKAPTSLLQVKESVSFLLDEPHLATVGPTIMDIDTESDDEVAEAEQDEEDEDEEATELARQNDGGFAEHSLSMPPPRLPATQRRTAAKPAVVDRLSLKRGSSTSETSLGRIAWAAPANGGFKAPSLLRRATTNVASMATDRGVTTSTGTSREGMGVKMGGSKKSSLAYQARAEERKAIVETYAKKRAENTARIAQMRRGSSGMLGRGLSGRFE